jgi:general secretion pathway protein D
MKPLLTVEITRRTLLTMASLLCLALAACCTSPPAGTQKKTFSSFDLPARGAGKAQLAVGSIDLQNAELEQVLALYQELSGRTVIRGPLPRPTITVRNQTPLNRIQALQLLDTVLSVNGIVMVLAGDTAVKAVPQGMGMVECPPEITLPVELLPESGSFMTRTVQLRKVKAVEVIPVLQPFTKTPNALLPIATSNRLIIRDYSANVRRMLQILQELETKPSR